MKKKIQEMIDSKPRSLTDTQLGYLDGVTNFSGFDRDDGVKVINMLISIICKLQSERRILAKMVLEGKQK